MPRKARYHYLPTARLRADFKRLMNAFIRAKTVRFEQFSEIWRTRKFSYIFAGRLSEREAREFLERAFLIAVEYFLPPYQFQVRVGGLYLLYGLFMTQPIAPKVKVRLTVSQWEDTIQLQQDASQQNHLDVVYIFNKMLEEHAFQFCYTPSEMNERTLNSESKDDEVNLADDMKEERREIDQLFDYESMEQMSYLLDHYHQMKVNMAGPKASKPDKSLDVVQDSLVEDLVVLLQSFKESVSNIYKHGSTRVPTSSGAQSSQMEEDILTKRQKIKAKMFSEPEGGIPEITTEAEISVHPEGDQTSDQEEPIQLQEDEVKSDDKFEEKKPTSTSSHGNKLKRPHRPPQNIAKRKISGVTRIEDSHSSPTLNTREQSDQSTVKYFKRMRPGSLINFQHFDSVEVPSQKEGELSSQEIPNTTSNLVKQRSFSGKLHVEADINMSKSDDKVNKLSANKRKHDKKFELENCDLDIFIGDSQKESSENSDSDDDVIIVEDSQTGGKSLKCKKETPDKTFKSIIQEGANNIGLKRMSPIRNISRNVNDDQSETEDDVKASNTMLESLSDTESGTKSFDVKRAALFVDRNKVMMNNEVSDVSHEKVARKRGRPPKRTISAREGTSAATERNVCNDQSKMEDDVDMDKVMVTNEVSDVSPVKVARKRGRPPKQTISLEEETSATTERNVCNDQSQMEDDVDMDKVMVTNEVSDVSPVEVARKRGRPPKQTISLEEETSATTERNVCNDQLQMEDDVDMGKDIVINEVSDVSPVKVARKRGRPPKQIILPGEGTSATNERNVSYDQSKTEGDVKASNTKQSLSEKSSVKRKRGRPPKQKLSPQEGTSSPKKISSSLKKDMKAVFKSNVKKAHCFPEYPTNDNEKPSLNSEDNQILQTSPSQDNSVSLKKPAKIIKIVTKGAAETREILKSLKIKGAVGTTLLQSVPSKPVNVKKFLVAAETSSGSKSQRTKEKMKGSINKSKTKGYDEPIWYHAM